MGMDGFGRYTSPWGKQLAWETSPNIVGTSGFLYSPAFSTEK